MHQNLKRIKAITLRKKITMKLTPLSLLLLILSVQLMGQSTKVASSVHVFCSDLQSEPIENDKISISSDFSQKHPVSLFQGTMYVSALAKISDQFTFSSLDQMGIRCGSIIGSYATLRIPLDIISPQLQIPGVEYFEIAGKIQPTLDRAIKDSRVDSAHMGWYLPMPITGKNVLIGITDWGFDYTHPMFYDTSLTYTRIAAAWDQFRTAGPAPSGFDYGTAFYGATELANAQCDTFNIYQYATHGSHVAGIAGGSGAGTIYRGVAFDSQFLFATFLVDAAAVVDAFNWMKTYAEGQGKRLVINMSWGLYYMGNLDGSSLLSQIIDQMSDEGVVFVSSAGNNGDVNFHIKKEFTSATDTMKTIVKFDSYVYYPTMWGQSITMWGSENDTFSIALKIYDTSNNLIAETPLYSTAFSAPYTIDTLIIGTDSIFYNLAADACHPDNQRPHFRLRIRNTKAATYKTALFATSDNATVHFWNVIELTNDVGNWGSDFQSMTTGWTSGDNQYGIGEPTCANSVITVAAHYSEFLMGGGTMGGGQIANFSSYGPLMTDTMKPDLSAPGVNVCSSISSFTTQSISPISVITSVDFGGRTYKFVRFSGTSMSSPHVAGVVALLLEANPLLTPAEIKTILRQSARQDDKTGVIPPEGSVRWGWGKLNALMAIYLATNTLAVNEQNQEFQLIIYPNPAKDQICIEASGFIPETVFVFDISGKFVLSENLKNMTQCINVSKLDHGTYLMFVTDGKYWKSEKFIKE
jgi:minor extracellular serine protease Vpr